MKKHVLLIISILSLVSLTIRAQMPVVVTGYVTAIETGYAIPGKVVTIQPSSMPVLLTAITNENGYYAIGFDMLANDTSAAVAVSVIDCRQETITQTFPVLNSNLIQADFQICTFVQGCQAVFTFQAQPANPLHITFSNLSTPVAYSTRWFWDFGDGETSADFEPVHLYSQPGIYNVCLTMVDSTASCTSISCIEIIAGSNSGICQALFTWLPQGLTVSFSDLSIGNPNSWFWNFGDGTSSGEQNPVHSWNTPGTFQVCLTIFNDSTQCQDTFCDYISVGDTLPTCHANFSYEHTEGLTYAFTNLSTGMFNEVIWDFGDGSPFLHEYNAVHTWQQPGIYHVCMAIFSNYTGCSDVLCVDITVGDTLSACQAAFTALVDSVPGNINHYWFIDESTGSNISNWYWDFGDGAVSFVQHPEYTFAESGTYNVCLTVSGQGNGGYCSDTICRTITTPAYSNLGGQIFAGNFPINNPDFNNDVARVTLFRKTGNRLTEVKSGLFSEFGYYFFLDVMEGGYVVHAELIDGSPSFMSYIPAYTGAVNSWQSAQPVILQGNDVFDATVFMQGLILPGSGPGQIAGSLVCIDNTPINPGEKIIFLFRNGYVVTYCHTDAMGNFSFNNLPLDSYTLKAEIAGIYSKTIEINLSGNFVQMLGLQVEISSSEIFGVNDSAKPDAPEIIIYPNPACEYLTISLISVNNPTLVCEVISSAGSILLHQDFELSKGENKFKLNLQPLSPGFYIIQFRNQEGTIIGTKKFIKTL